MHGDQASDRIDRSAPASGRYAGDMNPRLVLLLSGLLVGCSNATISEMRPRLAAEVPHCWLTLNFRSAPEGDIRDVRVVFDSVVLFKEEEFDWDYIAANDHYMVPEEGLGYSQESYVLDTDTTAESDPEPGKSMIVRFRLPSKKEVMVKPGDNTGLTATLYWGGKKQDSASRGLFLSYQSK
jgi:hypothetical protein